jgi:hypothetical protein
MPAGLRERGQMTPERGEGHTWQASTQHDRAKMSPDRAVALPLVVIGGIGAVVMVTGYAIWFIRRDPRGKRLVRLGGLLLAVSVVLLSLSSLISLAQYTPPVIAPPSVGAPDS